MSEGGRQTEIHEFKILKTTYLLTSYLHCSIETEGPQVRASPASLRFVLDQEH